MTRLPSQYAAVLGRLACPVCRGKLRELADGIGCQSCGRVYPLRDGIPVLIAEVRGVSAETS